MREYDLNDMVRGWFVGDFEPSALRTADVEVALKRYRAGDCEAEHYHRVATELTVVVSGKIRMFEREFREGAIVLVEPGEVTGFLAVTDAVTVVVKHPAVPSDKYLVSTTSVPC